MKLPIKRTTYIKPITLEIEEGLWYKFKDKVSKKQKLNDAIVGLIRNYILGREEMVSVFTIKNPILNIAHDWFCINNLRGFIKYNYSYRTHFGHDLINRKERDFLNKATEEDIKKEYGEDNQYGDG